MKKNRYLLLILLMFFSLFLSQSSHSQDITDKESQLIIKKSKEIVLEYNQLLNLLISPDIDEETIKELIVNSYQKGDGNQIFFSNNVIFEDDINPNHFEYKTANDVTLEKYLQNIDLFLDKSNDTTIVFSDIRTSNVKLGEYLYVKVFFKSFFKGKNKSVKKPYRMTERVAEIRAEFVNSKWKLYIMRVSFVTPDDLANPYKNDVDIVETAKIGAKKMDVATILKEKEKRKAMEEERKTAILFQKSMNTGDSSVKVRNYAFAIKAYQKAKEISPNESVVVDEKIQNTQLLQDGGRAALAKKKADEEAIAQRKQQLLEEQQKANNVKAISQKPVPNIGFTSSRRSPLGKILVGVVGLTAGVYAVKLNNDWSAKLSAIEKAKQSGDFNGFQIAYNDANQFKSSESIRNICVGVAAASLLTEVYLLVRKSKSEKQKFSFIPTNSTIGLALNYNF
jgi:tetratricopeptide (TPR) repeat protein